MHRGSGKGTTSVVPPEPQKFRALAPEGHAAAPSSRVLCARACPVLPKPRANRGPQRARFWRDGVGEAEGGAEGVGILTFAAIPPLPNPASTKLVCAAFT